MKKFISLMVIGCCVLIPPLAPAAFARDTDTQAGTHHAKITAVKGGGLLNNVDATPAQAKHTAQATNRQIRRERAAH